MVVAAWGFATTGQIRLVVPELLIREAVGIRHTRRVPKLTLCGYDGQDREIFDSVKSSLG